MLSDSDVLVWLVGLRLGSGLLVGEVWGLLICFDDVGQTDVVVGVLGESEVGTALRFLLFFCPGNNHGRVEWRLCRVRKYSRRDVDRLPVTKEEKKE